MNKRFLTFLAALTTSTAAFSQSPILVWEENLGGTSVDIATSIASTADGGSIVGGYTNSTNLDVVGHISGTDAWVLKLDASGSVEWKKIFGGTGDDKCHSIIEDASGNFVFAGTSNSSNGDITANLGAFDMWIAKLDAVGNMIFSKTLGGSDDDAAFGIVQTADGGYAMAGESKSDIIAGNANKGGYDCFIAKVSSTGSTIFQKLYGGSSDESLKSIAQTPNGNLYAAGETLSNNFDVSGNKGGSDFYVLRMRNNGSLLWAKTYGGTTNDNAHSIVAAGKSILIAGETESNNGDVPENNGGDDYWVLKINTSGAIAFSKVYGGETSDIARSIIAIPSGYLVVGESESASGDVSQNYGNDDVWAVGISKSGNIMFEKNYGGAITDVAYSAALTAEGDFLIAGASQSDNIDLTDNNGNDDYWVFKLDNPMARMIATESNTAISVYPNPTTNYITILGTTTIASVKVIDFNGKTIADENLQDVTTTVSLINQPAGIYFVTITMVDGTQSTHKLVKQ